MSFRLSLPFLSKSGESSPAITNDYALFAQARHGGPFFEAARQGKMFTGNMAAAGAVLPIYSDTAQVFGLWNPAGSGVNVVPVRLALTYVDTTGAAGGFCLGLVKNAPANLATGAAITAFTEGTIGTTIFNAMLGSGAIPKAKFTPSAATVTAPIILRQLGLNQTVLTAATTSSPQWNTEYEFHGDLVITPGHAVFVAGNIATLSKFAGSLTWVEEAA